MKTNNDKLQKTKKQKAVRFTVFAASSLNIISKFTPRFFYLKNNDPLQVELHIKITNMWTKILFYSTILKTEVYQYYL